MTENDRQTLTVFEGKLHRLIHEYRQKEELNKELSRRIEEKENLLKELQLRCASLEKNYNDSMMKHAETFHFQGALEYKNLTLGHKILLKMINSSMRNKLDLHQNHVSRDAVMPLINSLKKE